MTRAGRRLTGACADQGSARQEEQRLGRAERLRPSRIVEALSSASLPQVEAQAQQSLSNRADPSEEPPVLLAEGLLVLGPDLELHRLDVSLLARQIGVRDLHLLALEGGECGAVVSRAGDGRRRRCWLDGSPHDPGWTAAPTIDLKRLIRSASICSGSWYW